MPDIPTSEHVLAFLDIKHFICDIVEGRINCYPETQELTEAHLSLSILAVILLEEVLKLIYSINCIFFLDIYFFSGDCVTFLILLRFTTKPQTLSFS